MFFIFLHLDGGRPPRALILRGDRERDRRLGEGDRRLSGGRTGDLRLGDLLH